MSRAVSILIRAWETANPLRNCLLSLARFAPTECLIYVLDGTTPESGVREICDELRSSLPALQYLHSQTGRWWSNERIQDPERDLLLLDASAEVTAGFLQELQEVLYLHERHAVASPRSNNAAIFSIPLPEVAFAPDASYAVWRQTKSLLPRYQVMPEAAGFCALMKAEVLNRFNFWGHSEAAAYTDEADFICHINRYGYSAIAANRAYVFQHNARRKEPDYETLQFRYPEFERKLADYQQLHRNPIERFASLHLTHKPRILFDLFHLTAAHSGTSDFGLNLLRELFKIIGDEFELMLGMNQSARLFANELAGYRFYDDRPDSSEVFDLVFKPCQITSWTELRLMQRVAPRISYTMLDIIGVRCEYMNSPRRQILLQKAPALADCVFAISEFAHSDFAAFYQSDVPMRAIHLGTNSGMTLDEFRAGEYILLVGNDFVHKGVEEALRQLNDSSLPLVVLGGKEESVSGNVRRLSSGNLSRQHMRELFSNARILVYPSYYEGFGLPVVDALALGKPVVVLDSAINRELAQALPSSKLYRINSLQELPALVTKLFQMELTPIVELPRRWSHVAADYAQAFREILSRDIDAVKIRARWETLQTLDSADHL